MQEFGKFCLLAGGLDSSDLETPGVALCEV